MPLDERSAKYERRKEAIVGAAVAVINRKGVRGMTMGEVAAELKLVPTAVSYYFRRKEELAAACILQAIEVFDGMVADASSEAGPRESLVRFLRAFARFQCDLDRGSRPPIASFDDVRALNDQGVDAAFVEMFRRFRRTFNLEEGGERSRLRRNAKTHLLVSQVFWAVLWLKRYDAGDYERMIDRVIDIMLNGLASKGVPWRPVALEYPAPETQDQGTSQEAFLRAATEMINAHGYLGASVSRISERLNVTKGSFYHHNETKDDLVGRCFDRTLTIVRETQIAAERATTRAFDNLVTATSTLVERDVSGAAPLLRTSALSAVPADMQADLIRRFDRTSARFASVVADGIADGSIRPVDPNVAAQMITVTINASAELNHWAPGTDASNAAEVYIRPLFMGLFSAA